MIVDLSGYSTGVCDRLRQVTFCAAICKIVGDPVLEIYEILTDEGPFSIVDLFILDGFDIKKVNQIPYTSIKMNPQNSEINSATVEAHKPKNLNVDTEQFLFIWRKLYKDIKPRRDLVGLNDICNNEKFKKGVIAIHVRLSDRMARWRGTGAITQFQFDAFFEKKVPWIIKYANENGYSVFLSTDNFESDKLIRNFLRFRVSIIEYEKEWRKSGIRNTDGEAFLTDLFLMSMCTKIFSTTGGGVPLTAALIGGIDTESVHIWTEERFFDKVALFFRGIIVSSKISHNTKNIMRWFCK